jgi:hypothetical protein
MKQYWYNMDIYLALINPKVTIPRLDPENKVFGPNLALDSTEYSQSTNPDHAELLILRAVSTVPPITTSF